MSDPKVEADGVSRTDFDDDLRRTNPRLYPPVEVLGPEELAEDGVRTSEMRAQQMPVDDQLAELPTPPHGSLAVTPPPAAPSSGSRTPPAHSTTPSGRPGGLGVPAAVGLPAALGLPSLAELSAGLPPPPTDSPAPPDVEEVYERLVPLAGMRVIALNARPSDPPEYAASPPPLVALPPDPPTLRRSISVAPPAPGTQGEHDPGWTPMAAPVADTEAELAEDEIEITEDVPAPSTARIPVVRSLPPSAPPPATPPPAPPAVPTQAAAPKRKPWWEELFDQDYLRTIRRLTDRQLLAEVAFIEERLGLQNGAEILDLGCGTGRHANALVQRGYQVVGLDVSPTMIAAANGAAGARANFVQGDMRELAYDAAFDGVVCWGTTFGYFEEDKNAAVLAGIRRALRPGGVVLLDIANRDYVAAEQPNLVWFEGTGCVCIDETAVDYITSRLRVKRTMKLEDGRAKETDYSLRLYSLHEIGKLLKDAGFRVVEVSGQAATPGVFFGQTSPRCLVLAERD